MQEQHGPAAWRGDEPTRRDDWRHDLTVDEIAEIHEALEQVRKRDLAPEAMVPDDFSLPKFGERLRQAQHALEHGTGSFFLRGWPVERYDREDNARVFWGIASLLGTPISQSAKGEKIFPVQDSGLKVGHPKARGPNTRKDLSFHCDRCDVIGFLCIHQAKSGGENYLVSSLTVHNELLRRRPDLLQELYEPWYYKTHNVDLGNDDPWCRQPIFAVEDGRFVGYVLRVLIDRAYEMDELPDMTERQREALDTLEAICAEPEICFELRQEPGDMLFVNNFVNFHSRSAFEDHDDPEKKRLLYRIWLSMPNSRALPSLFAGSFGKTGAGELRGGIHPAKSDV